MPYTANVWIFCLGKVFVTYGPYMSHVWLQGGVCCPIGIPTCIPSCEPVKLTPDRFHSRSLRLTSDSRSLRLTSLHLCYPRDPGEPRCVPCRLCPALTSSASRRPRGDGSWPGRVAVGKQARNQPKQLEPKWQSAKLFGLGGKNLEIFNPPVYR